MIIENWKKEIENKIFKIKKTWGILEHEKVKANGNSPKKVNLLILKFVWFSWLSKTATESKAFSTKLKSSWKSSKYFKYFSTLKLWFWLKGCWYWYCSKSKRVILKPFVLVTKIIPTRSGCNHILRWNEGIFHLLICPLRILNKSQSLAYFSSKTPNI